MSGVAPHGEQVSLDEHTRLGLFIDEVAADFELLDVWRTPMVGAEDEFSAALDVMNSLGTTLAEGRSMTARLIRLREAMGRAFGWDDDENTLPIPGCTEISLRDRIPESKRAPLPAADPLAADPQTFPFRPVFVTEREFCQELSNRTVHALMHLAWVPEGEAFRAQLAVFVKHRGRFGRAYMALIEPFRHRVVYPAMMRLLASRWASRG